MHRRTLRAMLVVAVGLSLAPPAHAVDDAAGFTCGFTSTNDPTGQIIQDPNTQTGEVDGGPWAVVNETGGTISAVTVTCIFKINYGINDNTNIAASRTATTSGNVGVLLDTITYTALPGDDVYLCTHFHWSGSKGGGWVYIDDDDDATNGVQCALATSVEA